MRVKNKANLVWWHMFLILALGRQAKDSQGYTLSDPISKQKQKNPQKQNYKTNNLPQIYKLTTKRGNKKRLLR